jgi:ferrous iron transport protein A
MRPSAQHSFARGVSKPLSALAIGRAARVMFVTGEREFRRRLLEMGFCGGAIVEVIRRAAFGGPIELRVRGYELCLRNEQARCIGVAGIHVPSAESPSHIRKDRGQDRGSFGFLSVFPRDMNDDEQMGSAMTMTPTFGGNTTLLVGSVHHPLDAILTPRSVAVIGASDKTGSVGHAIMRNLTGGWN